MSVRTWAWAFAACTIFSGVHAAKAQSQNVMLQNFDAGTVAGATAVTASNSSSGGASNTVVANTVQNGSPCLTITDADGVYNGAVLTLPGAIPGPGYYIFTADVKVDNPGGIITYGMGVRAGAPSTTKISDENAGYVMNLTGANDGGLGFQTIGAALRVPAGGTFPRDVTLYFGTDPSGNSYNASAFDGNYNGTHRGGAATWPASTSNAVYVDNIRRIGPGNFGEERHLWISIGDNFTDLAELENILVQAKANNFNAINLLVRYRADAYYIPNRTNTTYPNPDPLGTRIGTKDVTPTNDPLQYAVDRCRELDMRIYAAFSCFLVTEGSTYPSHVPAGSTMWFYNAGSPRAMLNSDPSAEGLWADWARTDVQNYTKNVLMDLVANYDIDGVMLDRVRLPNSSYSYNPQGLSEMGVSGTPAPTDTSFRTKRRERLANWIRDVYESATDLKPWLVVGSAPIAYGDGLTDTYNSVMQYWPAWSNRKTRNRAISFGCMDLYQPQFYRLATGTPAGPAANTTLMNKAQFGDPAAFNLDFGLMPGSMTAISPLLFHPNTADTAQSNANAQNITDSRALAMSGWGLYPAKLALTDINLIRAPGASSAGTDVLASPSAGNDYLFKANFDNVPPNAVTNFAATAQADGSTLLTWTPSAPASDGEIPTTYRIYKSQTTQVRTIRANLVTESVIPGASSSYTVASDFAGTYYYRIVPVDDYNNRGAATAAGPVTVVGEPVPPADIVVDNPAASFVGSWTAATSAADKYGADYRYRGPGSGANTATFSFTPTQSGVYELAEWHSAGANRATNARHTVNHPGGANAYTVDQRTQGGAFNTFATHSFTGGVSGNVLIDDVFTGTVVMADAIRVRFVVQAPSAPSSLSATAVSTSQINLSWSDNATNERNVIVSRALSSGGPFTDIAAFGINVTSYSDTGLSPNTTYFYRVRASNSGGVSTNSNTASATTLPVPPAAPSGLAAAVVSGSQINLTWTDNATNETEFIVGRATASGGPYSDIATLGANSTGYASTGLSANTAYFYRVRAANIGGASANSNVASGTTLPNPPAAPTSLAAAAVSTSRINLTWTDNASNEVNYVVARATSSGGPYTDVATLGANVTSWSNTGLNAATTYFFRVRATNTGGASAESNTASATTQSAIPAAPSGLAASAVSGTQINLTWTDNASNESNFVVGRSTTSGGPYTDVATLAANTTSWSNTGLANNTTYFYVVRATNANGASANSAQASALTWPAEIILDNAQAGFTASANWITATSATDKYATNYRYRSAANGVNDPATFTYTAAQSRNYEVFVWWSQGTNRCTSVPYQVSRSGGTTTVNRNQTTGGGQWQSLGTFNVVAGSNTVNVSVNTTATGVVMADAIRIVPRP